MNRPTGEGRKFNGQGEEADEASTASKVYTSTWRWMWWTVLSRNYSTTTGNLITFLPSNARFARSIIITF